MIRRFFRWVREHWKLTLVSLFILLLIGMAVFAGGVTAWEYTNSTEFCGTTCHTMPPEYVAYQHSPHARVACVDCHLGQESVLRALPRKAMEVRHVVYALTQDYEIPIYVRNLRPARDTCEQCHNPDKFSNDSVKEIQSFGNDERNTERRTILALKTGGGSSREGLGRGIHWHVENEVWFLPNDPLKQDIPYVREVDAEGRVTEYYDLESDITPEYVAENEQNLRRMDCIDCHNRISHKFEHPNRSIDEAISKGIIDPSIPFIRAQAVNILTSKHESHETLNAAVENLDTWYKTTYPEYYEQNRALIAKAIEEIKRQAGESFFPEMQVGWETHPNNVGHLEDPGCFRCHDGKHVSPEGETIRLECNICHSIPRVAGPGLPAPVIALESGTEPESHMDSNWLARHREEFDETCVGCHSTYNRGGSDNSSFCANSACHGTKWVYAGLNAPGLRSYLPEPTESSEPVIEAPTPDAEFVPRIPHPLDDQRIGQCLNCHGPDGLRPYTEFHVTEGFPAEACTECHKLAPVLTN
ncbi:MAG: NapC/NirT family cytochrome c [Caldilineales bacterium]|nr:NapC/NirT family cytochrome c [Caldilineales bacterium]